jgi:hypothetical protein
MGERRLVGTSEVDVDDISASAGGLTDDTLPGHCQIAPFN